MPFTNDCHHHQAHVCINHSDLLFFSKRTHLHIMFLYFFQVITDQPAPSSDNPADSLIVPLDDPELKSLRRRNIFFLVLAGVSCLVCGNLFFGVLGLVFNTIAEFDFGSGKKASGRKNSKIGLILTFIGLIVVAILVLVVVLLSMSD